MLRGVKVGDKFRITIYDTLDGEAVLLRKGLFNAKIKVLDYTTCYNCQGPLVSDEIEVTAKEIAGYATAKGKVYEKYKSPNLFKRILIKGFIHKNELPF